MSKITNANHNVFSSHFPPIFFFFFPLLPSHSSSLFIFSIYTPLLNPDIYREIVKETGKWPLTFDHWAVCIFFHIILISPPNIVLEFLLLSLYFFFLFGHLFECPFIPHHLPIHHGSTQLSQFYFSFPLLLNIFPQHLHTFVIPDL